MRGIPRWIDFRGKTGVYLIRNKVNNKRYVGSSLDIATRLSHHFGKLWKSCGNYDMHKEIRYYGRKNFECKILEETTKNNLKYAEQKWIDKLNPEYNKCNVAGGFREGKTYTEYSKQANKAKHQTEEYKAYMKKMKTSEIGVKVKMIDLLGVEKTFDSYTLAYEYLVKTYGITSKKCSVIGHIRECCDGKRKFCYSCTFERVETIRKE